MTTSNEILLTVEELKQIETFVLQNPQLADPNSFNIGKGHCSVVKVSRLTGLIIAQGNEFTGFEHIHSRHEFFSIVPYWKEVKENDTSKIKLQDQSRFRPDSIPFWDYISIADSIYKSENLNIEKNTRIEDFDLYPGYHTNKDGSSDLYKMLLYKNSKVIHTLYPQSNKNNRKKISKFNFARGVVKGNHDYKKEIVEITIPYLNSDKKNKYSILIRKYLSQKVEEAIIIVHDETGAPQGFVSVAERRFNTFIAVPVEIITWQHTDLRELEEYIKRIDKQIQDENAK
jgi:hypothetical protein